MSTEKIPAKRIRTRAIRLRDYEAICALQLICFPGMLPWKKNSLKVS